MNIFNKIYEIMNEYDKLLLEKDNYININNISNNNEINKNDIDNDKNEYYINNENINGI
jgi:hypothetical protein